MSEAQSNKAKGPRRPIEQIRAELMADPHTREIADTLGVSLEDYVAKVLEYVQNPDKQPMLYVADEAELRAMGEEVHTTEDVADWFGKVASGEIKLAGGPMEFKDGFAEGGSPGAKKPVLGGAAAGAQVPVPKEEAGNALRDQVAKQLKKGDNFKG